MPSAINGAVPPSGDFFISAQIRSNFETARQEITTLQTDVAARLLVAGGNVTGPLTIAISNLRLTGGAVNNTIYTDGAGNLAWGPTAAAVASGNPTAQINGPAINGTAATFMRSDAVPALAQIITPGTVTNPASITFDGTGRITAASSGVAGNFLSLAGGALTGALDINRNPAAPRTAIPAPSLRITSANTGGTANAIFTLDAVQSPQMLFRKMNGTVAAPAILGDGDPLGVVSFQGFNNVGVTGFTPGAEIQVGATQAWSAANTGCTMAFLTTANSGVLQVNLQITSSGGVVVGQPSGGDMGGNTLNVQKIYLNGLDIETLFVHV